MYWSVFSVCHWLCQCVRFCESERFGNTGGASGTQLFFWFCFTIEIRLFETR